LETLIAQSRLFRNKIARAFAFEGTAAVNRFGEVDMAALLEEFRDPEGSDVFGPFIPSHFGVFDPAQDTVAELASLLWSVRTAGRRYRMVSLGAAPGEWAVRAERSYKKLFPNGDYMSFNFEGDPEHVELTKAFLRNNHANIEKNVLVHAVIAEKDGWAYFPVIDSDIDWGAGIAALSESPDDLDSKVNMTEIARRDRIAANGGKPLEFRTVQAVSLRSLLDRAGEVDFIHSDIQGSEEAVFTANIEAMNERVRICCIGTHGSGIESALLDVFAEHRWNCDCAFPCVMQDDRVIRDGIFVWSNPRRGWNTQRRITSWLVGKKYLRGSKQNGRVVAGLTESLSIFVLN
jgi:FkbM family methyltransferase